VDPAAPSNAAALGAVGGPRDALDRVIREAAEALDVSAGRLRRAIDAVLAEAARLGMDVASTRTHVRPADVGPWAQG
jgi:hypothetical protein